MGNVIYPECAKPIFLIPSHDVAFDCGLINMSIFAVIVSVICLIILYFKFKKTTIDPVSKKEQKSANWWVIIINMLVIISVWICVPLMGWMNSRSWDGEQLRIQSLIDASDGKLTRGDVIKDLHKLYEKEQQARRLASFYHHNDRPHHGRPPHPHGSNVVDSVISGLFGTH